MAGFILGSPELTYRIGIFAGWMIAAGYVLLVLKFLVRHGYQRFVAKMPAHKPFRKNYLAIFRMLTAAHSYLGLSLVPFILLHAIIQLPRVGFFISGIIALTLMLAQISLGAYGKFYKGRKKRPWLTIHRTLAALLAVAIVFHIITVS